MCMEEKLFDVEFKDLEEFQFLSKGNYGELYKASYFGTDVAVKKLLHLENRAMHKYIERELCLLKTMRHPNIVQYMGLCKHNQDIYVVTEFVEGGDLFDKLRDLRVNLSWKKRVELAIETCKAICYLHSKHVIHRDLKSQNLLVDKNLKVKVCDFGFARSSDREEYMTVCGTDEWIAPEVLLGEKYNIKADVYSFGMILCELITRHKPPKREVGSAFSFDFNEFRNIIDKECPEEFISICEDCTKFYAEDRPDLNIVLKRLKELLKTLPNRNSSEVITTVDLAKELNGELEIIECSDENTTEDEKRLKKKKKTKKRRSHKRSTSIGGLPQEIKQIGNNNLNEIENIRNSTFSPEKIMPDRQSSEPVSSSDFLEKTELREKIRKSPSITHKRQSIGGELLSKFRSISMKSLHNYIEKEEKNENKKEIKKRKEKTPEKKKRRNKLEDSKDEIVEEIISSDKKITNSPKPKSLRFSTEKNQL